MSDKNENILLRLATGDEVEQPAAPSAMAIIRAEHALLKAACDLLGLGYFTWDLHSGDQFWSEQSYRVLGLPQDIPPTHQLFMSRVHPDDREYVLRATEQGLASQEAFYYEFRILLDDNSVRYIQSRLGAASPSSGTVFGTNMDVTEARLARQALELSEERLTEACHLLHLGYFSWDLVSNAQVWSDETYEVLGIPVGSPVERDTFEKAVHPADKERVLALSRKGIETGEETVIEYRVIRQNGEIRHIRSFLSIKCDKNGKPISVLGSNLDITDAKRAEQALKESEARQHLAQKIASIGNCELDLETGQQHWSDTLYQLYGLATDTPPQRETFLKLVHPEDLQQFLSAEQAGMARGKDFSMGFRLLRSDESVINLRMHMHFMRDADGNLCKLLSTAQDVTQQKRAEEALTYQAQHDGLTGLANRFLLNDRLNQSLARGCRHGYGFALLAVDLDHFKPVNDRYGHPAGDQVLLEVARRMRAQTRINDLVARTGGDEFIILLDGKIDEEDIKTAANKIICALSEPMTFTDFQCQIGASIGGALYPKHGSSAQGLLMAADQALYRAKQAGRNNAQFAADV